MIKFLVIYLVLCVTIFAWAGNNSACAEDLLTIYDQAITNAPELKAAYEYNAADQKKYYQGLALLLPSVDGSLETSRSKYQYRDKHTRFYDKYYYDHDYYSVEAIQPVININKWRQFSLSSLSAEISDIDHLSIKQQFIIDLATIYFDLVFAKENLFFSIAEKKAIKQRLEQANNELSVGLSSEVEALEAQARYDMASASQIEHENSILEQKNRLVKVLGFCPEKIQKLKTPIPLEYPEHLNIQAWTSQAVKNSRDLQLSELNIEYKRLEVKKAFSGHYPFLDIVGTYECSEKEDTPSEAEYKEGIVMLKLSVPIFAGGGIYAKTSEEKHRLKAMEHAFEDKKREVIKSVRKQYNKITASMGRVKALRQAVLSSEKVLSSRELGYQVGTSTLTEVLDAQSRLYLAQKNLTEARHDYLLSCLRLKNTAGVLDRDDVVAINALLEQ